MPKRRLRGSPVTLKTSSGEVSGTVLSVEQRKVPAGGGDKGQVIDTPVVNLITPAGIKSVFVSDVQNFTINDAKIAAEMNKALAALADSRAERIKSLDFSALKGLKIGSAPTPKELMDAVEAAFGVPVGESYGLTEGGPVMIGAPRDGRRAPHGSCGVIWPEGECKLVGADGVESPNYGELWVRNPGVTPGYYKLPEVNRERLIDGWLRTGDLFSLDDQGFYYFRGRVDDMFNSGGENVYPLEVENILLKNTAVAECSVVPFPHAIKGEVPVAMVVRSKTGAATTEDELKKFCLANGPAYAHPRRIHFVDKLPLNGPGKIDRKLVTQQMRAIIGDQPLGG